MADFTKTIQMSVEVLQQPNLWGTMIWGTDDWGYGASLNLEIGKLISESIDSNDTMSKDVGKVLTAEAIASTFEMTDEEITDPAGYNRVFTTPTVEAESRQFSTFTETAAPTTTWTEGTEPTTDWTEE